MKSPSHIRLPILLLTFLCLTWGKAQAASVSFPFEQVPVGTDDAVAPASLMQAGLLVQSFSMSSSATSLSWWGTAAEPTGFWVSLQPGLDSPPDLSTPWTVTRHDQTSGDPAPRIGIQVLADVDNDPDTPMELELQQFDVYRYSIDLGVLPAGDYSLAIWETKEDLAGRSWFWLHGIPASSGRLSRSWDYDEDGLLVPHDELNGFALSLRLEGERGGAVPEPMTAWLVAAAMGLLGNRPKRRRSAAV